MSAIPNGTSLFGCILSPSSGSGRNTCQSSTVDVAYKAVLWRVVREMLALIRALESAWCGPNATTARRWSPATLSSEPWRASGRCSRMDTVTIIGLFAAFCTTISYFPQLKKCWQTGSAGDLSLKTFATLAVGVALWVLYGFLKSDIVIILANVISFCLLIGILYFKLRERLRDQPEGDAQEGVASPG
jgi:MtN3 and saliva related transmembrane protein